MNCPYRKALAFSTNFRVCLKVKYSKISSPSGFEKNLTFKSRKECIKTKKTIRTPLILQAVVLLMAEILICNLPHKPWEKRPQREVISSSHPFKRRGECFKNTQGPAGSPTKKCTYRICRATQICRHIHLQNAPTVTRLHDMECFETGTKSSPEW